MPVDTTTFQLNAMPLNPKIAKLREAIAEFSEKKGVNAVIISLVTEKFVGLLAARFEHICDSAYDEDNDGKISVGVRMSLDLSRKVPCGKVTLRFIPKSVSDDADWHGEDPDQVRLPLEGGTPAPGRRRRRTTVTEVPEVAAPEAAARA